MKTNQLFTLLLLFSGISLNVAFSQNITINEEWNHIGCTQGNNERTATSIDSNGHLLILTNKATTSGSGIHLSSRHANGNLIWETALNSLGNDYGTDIKVDSNGDIFISGTKYNGQNLDFYLAKFNSNGSLIWEELYDGYNKDDIPSSIDIDESGNVYLLGTSRVNNLNTNIVITKYNGQNGSTIWQEIFDYGNKLDVGTKLIVKNNDLFVSGSYVGNANTTGIIVLKYAISNGALLASTFYNAPQRFHLPTSMKISENGDIYILSSSTNINQTNRDIEILALDDSFNTIWYETFDNSGLDDEGSEIIIDSDGNPVFTGYCTKSNGNPVIYTSKRDSQSGTQIWSDERGSQIDLASARGFDIGTDGLGNIIVVGELTSENTKDFLTYAIDLNGKIKWQRQFSREINSNDKPLTLEIIQDIIYVSGLFTTNSETKIQTVKYRINERTITPRVVDGIESHVQNEIIVRFDENAILPEAVNKIGFDFGTLDQFVKPDVIAQIQNVYPNIPWVKATTYKIFKRMTIADSISITRNGLQIKTQPFWAILLINVQNEDEIIVCNALNANQVLFPNLKYAHTNGLVSLDIDPLYPLQHSLSSSTYPEAHINIENAWNFETGQPYVKVGVFDTGIKWNHEEMGGDHYGNCATCKVKGGWDYQIGADLYYSDNNGDNDDFPSSLSNGHGTKVAGIIGGLKNNGLGISGIAGGNYPYTNPALGDPENVLQPGESIGVSMYGFRAVTIGLTLTEICNALVEGATYTGTFGYGLHVMNNSWSRNTQYNSEVPILGAQNLMRDCQREIFRNQTVNVCSRGNNIGTNNYFPEYAEREFWVLNVGGSDVSGVKHPNSGYGGDVDIIAPYDQSLVETTGNLSVSEYVDFSGTSASAPHVTGVASLMLSHINNQSTTPNDLAPDDVEFLIQKYASDIPATVPGGYLDGYDELSGWGLLDAGSVMDKVDRTQYVIKHYTAEYVVEPIPSGESFLGNFNFGTYDIPYGQYYGEVFSHPFIIQNNLNPGDVILNYWPLNSYSNLLDELVTPPFPSPWSVTNETGCHIFSMSNLQGDVRGTIVHLLNDPWGNPVDIWHPVAPGDVATVGYTLHIQSDFAGLGEGSEELLNITCYPNPSSKNVNLSFVMRESGNIDIEVVDINGRVVFQSNQLYFAIGQQTQELNSSVWTEGMYFIHVRSESGEKTVKFIKQ